MLSGARLLIPRTIISAESEVISPTIETTAAKALLRAEVYAQTGSKAYRIHLQAFDMASAKWFDLYDLGIYDTVSTELQFYDMVIPFPPSDWVKLFLTPRMRVRVDFSGTGTLTYALVWADQTSTRQAP
jgi:hypothetical protein